MDLNHRAFRIGFTVQRNQPLCQLTISFLNFYLINLVGSDGFEPPCLSDLIYSQTQSSTLPTTHNTFTTKFGGRCEIRTHGAVTPFSFQD